MARKTRKSSHGGGFSVPSFITGMVVGSFFCFLIWALASRQYDGPEAPEVALPAIDTPLSGMKFEFYDLLPQAGSQSPEEYSPDAGTMLLVPTDADDATSERPPDATGTAMVQEASTEGPAEPQRSPIPEQVGGALPDSGSQTHSPSAASRGVSSPLQEASTKTASGYVIQVGSFMSRKRAEQLRAKLIIQGFRSHTAEVSVPGDTAIYRVLVGPYDRRPSAAADLRSLSGHSDLKPLLLEMRHPGG